MLRILILTLVAAMFAGCAGASRQSLSGAFTSEEARRKLDDERCREFGFKPGTEGYAHCRLRLEEIRASGAASAALTCRRSGNALVCR